MRPMASNLCILAYLPQNFLTVVEGGRKRQRVERVEHISSRLGFKPFKSLTLLNLLSQAARDLIIHRQKKKKRLIFHGF